MADFITTNPNVVVEYIGVDPSTSNIHSYNFKSVDGKNAKKVDIDIAPDVMKEAVGQPAHNLYPVVSEYVNIFGAPGQDRGDIVETVIPAAQKGVASVAGFPVDLSNLVLHAGVDLPANFIEWAASGFGGAMPSKRYVSSAKPVGGTEWLAENIEGGAKAASEFVESLTGVDLQNFGIDMSPKEDTKFRKYLSLITQVMTAAPGEGQAIIKIVKELAKKPGRLTDKDVVQRVSEAMGELQARAPMKSALLETTAGAMAGLGMVKSLDGLEAAWPDAPEWAKQVVMAGGGVAAPIVGIGAGPIVKDVLTKFPILSIPAQAIRGVMEMMTSKGIQQAAARAIQATGGEDPSAIINIRQQLLLAQSLGRDMDATTRVAYTLPQMARNEARLLQAELKANAHKLDPEQIKLDQEKINDLRIFANVQEGQLATIYGDPKIRDEVYILHSEKLLDRAAQIKTALNDVLFKTDLGGEPSPAPGEKTKLSVEDDWMKGEGGAYVYAENRQRALLEGRSGAISEATLRPTKKALDTLTNKFDEIAEASLADAEQRALKIRSSIPDNASPAQRAEFNEMIRRELEASYMEISNLESLIWNGIKGLEKPKETIEFIVGDKGEPVEIGPSLVIGADNQPLTQYFADMVANLKAGDAEDQSRWLWKLAGRRALIDSARKKGDRPDEIKAFDDRAKRIDQLEKERKGILEGEETRLRAEGVADKSQSLVEFLVSEGGLIDEGGNVTSMGGHQWHLKPGGQNIIDGKIRGKLVVAEGQTNNRARRPPLTLEQALQKARDAGYLDQIKKDGGPDQIDTNDLLLLIGEEIAGVPQYSSKDAPQRQLRDSDQRSLEENERLVRDEAEKLGILKPDEHGMELPHPKTKEPWTLDQLVEAVDAYHAETARLAASEDAPSLTLDDVDASLGRLKSTQKEAETDLANLNETVTSEAGAVDLAKEVKDIGELGVRRVRGVLTGRSGQEVQKIISHLKREHRMESGKGANRNPTKMKNISALIDDLEGVLFNNQNFDLDIDMLNAARRMTATKKALFETGGVGRIRGYKPTGEPRVELESIDAVLLPAGTAGRAVDPQVQLTAVRDVQNALTKVKIDGSYDPDAPAGVQQIRDLHGWLTRTDYEGPFRLNTKTGLPELNPAANWAAISGSPPAPFVEMRVPGVGRKYGLEVEPNTAPTQENIDIVKATLWRRFQAFGGGEGTTFQANAAQKWIDDNQAAIQWLEKATNQKSGFQDLKIAESIVDGLRNADHKNQDQIINDLRKRGVFGDTLTEQALREAMDAENAQLKNMKVTEVFLEADPLNAAQALLNKFLDPSHTTPIQSLDEIMKVLQKGALDDGSNPALDGFKAAVAEALFKRSLTGAEGQGPIAREAARLDHSLKQEVKFLDGGKMLQLVENDNVILLLKSLYGEHAPELMRTFARGAAEQSAVGTTAREGVGLQGTQVTDEIVANFGRIAGLWFSKTGVMNPLIAAGVGRRLAVGVARELKGKGMERNIAEALIDPEYGLMLMKLYPTLNPSQKAGLGQRMKKWAATTFLSAPYQRLKKLGYKIPGALYEATSQEGMPLDLEEGGPSAALEPSFDPIPARWQSPSRFKKVASVDTAPRHASGSLLDKVKFLGGGGGGIGGGGMGAGTTAPGTAGSRGQEIFGPMDPVFKGAPRANQGGLVSLCGPNKAKQMVS